MKTTGGKQIAETITDRLFENIAKIKFGSVSVTLKIHSGRIMDITHSITESTRDTAMNFGAEK